MLCLTSKIVIQQRQNYKNCRMKEIQAYLIQKLKKQQLNKT